MNQLRVLLVDMVADDDPETVDHRYREGAFEQQPRRASLPEPAL